MSAKSPVFCSKRTVKLFSLFLASQVVNLTLVMAVKILTNTAKEWFLLR